MSTSIHSILDKRHWTYDELKLFLEQDASSVNERDLSNQVPLHRVLRSENCTLDCLKLLLHHGADVKYSEGNQTAIVLAITRRNPDPDFIRLLVEAGAEINELLPVHITPLGLAFYQNTSLEIIRTLLECGATIGTVEEFPTMLHCAANANLKAEMCEFLLKFVPRERLNLLNRYGQSLMCTALRRKTEIGALKMMLAAGCSLDACQMHDSAFLCATAYSTNLKGDVVQMLHECGVNIAVTNDINETPLQCALRYCRYDNSAIELLFALQEKKDNVRLEVILLDAARNLECKMDIIKMLIDKGALCNVADEYGLTPLHLVLSSASVTPEIVKMLIENGAPLNVSDREGQTPLFKASRSKHHTGVLLEMLLKAGARMKTRQDETADEFLLKKAQDENTRYAYDEEINFEECKLLLKYAFLEDINFHLSDVNYIYRTLHYYTTQCRQELRKMQTQSIGEGVNLYQFINRNSEAGANNPMPTGKNYDFGLMLQVLGKNTFPVYFDVISSRIGRRILESQLKKMVLYTVKGSPDSSIVKLNYECVAKIAQNLGEDDLLRVILAFCFPN